MSYNAHNGPALSRGGREASPVLLAEGDCGVRRIGEKEGPRRRESRATPRPKRGQNEAATRLNEAGMGPLWGLMRPECIGGTACSCARASPVEVQLDGAAVVVRRQRGPILILGA